MGFHDDRRKRVAVFEDTIKQCKTNDVLFDAITNSIRNQVVYLEEESVPDTASGFQKPCDVIVSKKRTFEAAMPYTNAGKKVCILNFANAVTPGGGVLKGSKAQEEGLCRCSTLYPAISSAYVEFYNRHKRLMYEGKMNDMGNNDCIFTPDVIVFKTDTHLPETMSESDWYKVDVITCAAPDLREVLHIDKHELFALHKKRVARILQVAALQGDEVVILGAFGCGAFKNPPEIVAQAEKEAVIEFREKFEKIEFAVYCRPEDSTNYDVFSKVMANF